MMKFRSVQPGDVEYLAKSICDADGRALLRETGRAPKDALGARIEESMNGGHVFAIDGDPCTSLYNSPYPIALCGAIGVPSANPTGTRVGTMWLTRSSLLGQFKGHSHDALVRLKTRLAESYDVLRMYVAPKQFDPYALATAGLKKCGYGPHGEANGGFYFYVWE